MSGFNAPNHTQVPNAFFDMMANMSESEMKVTLHAIRKTLGWHKSRDEISLTQFQEGTGLSRQSVLNGIKSARLRGTIRKAGQGKKSTAIYQVVIDEPIKEPVSEVVNNSNQSKINTSSGLNIRPELVQNLDTQKKGKKKKEKGLHPLPIQDDNYVTVRALVEQLGVLATQRDNQLFGGDYKGFSIDEWKAGIEIFIKRRKEKNEYLPYKFLVGILKRSALEAEQSALVEASKPVTPYHLPVVIHEQARMSDEDATSLMEDFKRMKESAEASKV